MSNAPAFFFGLFFLIAGVALLIARRNQKQQLFSVQAARAVTASELSELSGAIAAEIGGGNWRDYVKLWGEVVTETPLRSDHRKEPCVHYVSKVSRKYQERDKDGNLKDKTETISKNQQSMPFWLRDRTGQIKVDPTGANIETIDIMDDFRPERSGRTLGYQYKESILPVGREILVVGAVSDLTGDVIIGKPLKSDHKYIVSLKNEELLAHNLSRNAKNSVYGMVGCFAIGAILLVVGLW